MKLGKALIASTMALGIVAGGAAVSASATTGNGILEYNEIGFYYNQNLSGSMWDSVYWQSSAFTYQSTAGSPQVTFISAGSGQGSAVRNNAASVNNRNDYNGGIYYYVNQGGPSDYVTAQNWRNLSTQLRNNNASYTLYH